MRKRSKRRYTISLMLAMSMLTACAANPEQDIVISKNDGAFESNMAQTAPQQHSEEILLNRTDSFFSMDGSVEFTWNVDQTISTGAMPVVKVEPYFFTGEDAKQIISALFGSEVDFYDLGPESERQFSKAELQEKISMLTQYSNAEDLRWLMGDEASVSEIKKRIDQYMQDYETAPNENPRPVCDWTLKPESYYYDHDEENGSTEYLIATSKIGDVNYEVTVQVHNKPDYQKSRIQVTLGDGNDDTYVESTISFAELCITEEPTQDQIDAIKENAQVMLDNMGMGEFIIAETMIDVRYFGDTPAYRIRVEAEPALEGASVLYGDLGKSNSNEDSYASDYPVTQIQFFFSVNGDLTSFNMHSLTEVKEIVNSNVATIPFDDLIEQAQTHLALYDAAAMDESAGNARMLELTTGRSMETLDCKVEIVEVDYGLARFPIANSSSFYYAPAVIFRGTIDYCEPETGEVVTGTGNPYGTRVQTLLVINAVDGTIY